MMCKQKSWATKMTTVLIVFSIILPSTIAFGEPDEKDYYYEGQDAAERDYNGGNAMVGGAACGCGLGLIGWALGYLIIANKDIDVPRHYVSRLDTRQRREFEDGYKDYVKKRRKGKFNMGAGIGTLVGVVFVLGLE